VVVVRVDLGVEGVVEGEVYADPDRLLTGAEVAELLGIRTSTWRGYVLKGLAPLPDEPDDKRPANLRRPKWRLSSVRAYKDDPRRGRVGRPRGAAA
jgi:hypothetical protein